MYGPFKTISAGHNDQYCKFKLPTSWNIHLTINKGLLGRYRGKGPEREEVEIEADDAGRKMENIIASGPSNNDAKKHVYLIRWETYTQEENTWETYENVVEYAEELLEEYYSNNENTEKDNRVVKR